MRDSTTVIMLTWEFPPRIVGGIASHVYNLSRVLTKLGVKVHVVTCDFPEAAVYEEIDDVIVHRFDSYRSPTPDFATWVLLMNTNMQKSTISLLKTLGVERTLVHAHDWLAARAGIGLKHIFRIPLVATIHATEYGRRNGLPSNYSKMIHQTEAWLVYEAWRVICCSNFMASQVNTILGVSRDKMDVIPNGVDPTIFADISETYSVRNKFVTQGEKLVLFVGRLVYEKGLDVFMDAVPRVLAQVNAKFVIVGDGYLKDGLLAQVAQSSFAQKVFVTGFLDDRIVRTLFKCADVCVIPSRYEPFGIVALEAMAAKTPVVVSDVGGLSEVIEEETGVRVSPNNSKALAKGIVKVLEDHEYSEKLRSQAYKKILEKYDWSKIAETTVQTYNKILNEYFLGDWQPTLNLI